MIFTKINYFCISRNYENVIDEMSRLYYLVKLNFFLDNYEPDIKVLSLTIICKLLKFPFAYDNYKKIGGLQFLLLTIKKSENSKIRVLTLNCIKGFTKNYEELPLFKKATPLDFYLKLLE
jgi:hypothetical protein